MDRAGPWLSMLSWGVLLLVAAWQFALQWRARWAGSTRAWFVDRSAGSLPRPVVISAPLWLYRLLMLAWARVNG